MPSRAFGAVLVALWVAGVATAQPQVLPSVPCDAPPAGLPADGDGLFTAPSAADRLTAAGSPQDYRWWFTAEYLLGYTKPSNLPPVATSGTVGSLGIVGRTGTQVLLGGEQDYGGISGGRFGGGLWLDSCHAYAVDWGVFYLPTQRTEVAATAGSAAVLARPFFDTLLNVENVRLVSQTGLFDGSVSSRFSTFFWGAELGATVRVLETSSLSFDQLFHFRYYSLEESLGVSDRSRSIGGTVYFNGAAQPLGTTVSVTDYFSAINRWYGGAAGIRVNWTSNRLAASLTGRLGVGAAQQNVTVDGNTTRTTAAGVSTSTNGGMFSAGQTLGNFAQYRLSLAPEVGVKVSYHVTDHIALTVGYQFLYITNLARPGQIINRNINPSILPSGQNFGTAGGPATPGLDVRSTDFWMHSLAAGLMLTF